MYSIVRLRVENTPETSWADVREVGSPLLDVWLPLLFLSGVGGGLRLTSLMFIGVTVTFIMNGTVAHSVRCSEDFLDILKVEIYSL